MEVKRRCQGQEVFRIKAYKKIYSGPLHFTGAPVFVSVSLACFLDKPQPFLLTCFYSPLHAPQHGGGRDSSSIPSH
jgi:hypothetical protein